MPSRSAKRRRNEKIFQIWEDLPDGGRRYCYTVEGRSGWKAHYIKEVDADERTVKFYQEIYNERGELVEVHQKYPFDEGHKPIRRKKQNQ